MSLIYATFEESREANEVVDELLERGLRLDALSLLRCASSSEYAEWHRRHGRAAHARSSSYGPGFMEEAAQGLCWDDRAAAPVKLGQDESPVRHKPIFATGFGYLLGCGPLAAAISAALSIGGEGAASRVAIRYLNNQDTDGAAVVQATRVLKTMGALIEINPAREVLSERDLREALETHQANIIPSNAKRYLS